MRVAALVSLSLLSLAACVHASPYFGPNGERGFVIRCGGRFNDMSSCYNRAHDECGGPYRIVQGVDDQRIQTTNYYTGQQAVVDHRELTIVCGG